MEAREILHYSVIFHRSQKEHPLVVLDIVDIQPAPAERYKDQPEFFVGLMEEFSDCICDPAPGLPPVQPKNRSMDPLRNAAAVSAPRPAQVPASTGNSFMQRMSDAANVQNSQADGVRASRILRTLTQEEGPVAGPSQPQVLRRTQSAAGLTAANAAIARTQVPAAPMQALRPAPTQVRHAPAPQPPAVPPVQRQPLAQSNHPAQARINPASGAFRQTLPSFEEPPPEIDLAFAPIRWAPGDYTIICVLDNREIKDGKSRDFIADNLTTKGVKLERRALELGDVLWIARDHYGTEVVLDFIVERKRLDDLIAR